MKKNIQSGKKKFCGQMYNLLSFYQNLLKVLYIADERAYRKGVFFYYYLFTPVPMMLAWLFVWKRKLTKEKWY